MLLSVWCELEFSGGLIKEVIVIFFLQFPNQGIELSWAFLFLTNFYVILVLLAWTRGLQTSVNGHVLGFMICEVCHSYSSLPLYQKNHGQYQTQEFGCGSVRLHWRTLKFDINVLLNIITLSFLLLKNVQTFLDCRSYPQTGSQQCSFVCTRSNFLNST